MYRAVKNSLRNDYTLVAGPGPGVKRIRAAITEAEGSWVVLDTICSLHPGTLALSGLKHLAIGTGSFVAETAVELEIELSLTHKPLIMAGDRRVGGKGWEKKFNSRGKTSGASLRPPTITGPKKCVPAWPNAGTDSCSPDRPEKTSESNGMRRPTPGNAGGMAGTPYPLPILPG